jgi:malate dehydrogenase (oxaloacetate-decarboxylating)(NADP+)
MGHEPRVALLSYSTFGNPMREKSARIREAVKVLDGMQVDFEYDGEMSAGVALNKEIRSLYPFCRLSGPANVLVMPALHTAHVSSQLVQELSDGVTIGPVLMGLSRPAQIVQMNASLAEIMNLAAVAAMHAITEQQGKVTKIGSKGKKKA